MHRKKGKREHENAKDVSISRGARTQLVPLAETGKEVVAKIEQAIERKIKKRLC